MEQERERLVDEAAQALVRDIHKVRHVCAERGGSGIDKSRPWTLQAALSRNVQELQLAIASAKAQGVTTMRESMTQAEELLQEVKYSQYLSSVHLLPNLVFNPLRSSSRRK